MGIQKVELYVCTCDNCGRDYEECDLYMVYPDEVEADNAVRNNGDWIKEDGKYYCTNCYSYDRDDKLIISKKDDNDRLCD